MNYEEIRKLAQQIYCDKISIKRAGLDGIAERMSKCFDLIVDYANTLERCEKLRFNMIPHKHDREIVNYIEKGEAK